MKNGFDIDGVISVGIFPGPNDIIITGRSFEEQDDTMEYLSNLNIPPIPVFFNTVKFDEKSRVQSGQHKARLINGLGITRFFEDDEIQIQEILKENPTVEIVHIKHELTEKENVRRNSNNEIIL